MQMYFLLLQLRSIGEYGDPRRAAKARCWVKAGQLDEARGLASDSLAEQGWEVVALDEACATSRDDYFPPCESLEAFQQAERLGVVCRID